MIVAIITARYASKRLPGKVLADINGEPMLYRIACRVKQSKVDEVMVATTLKDNEIRDYCLKHKISFYMGSELDILDRLYCAACSIGADVIVRVWGDCPMVDPYIIDDALGLFKSGYLYTNGYPIGQNIAIVDFKTLEDAYLNVKDPEDRHWIHNYLKRQNNAVVMRSGEDLSHIRLVVDTEDDLMAIRRCCQRPESQNGSNYNSNNHA